MEEFERIEKIIDKNKLKKLRNAKVLIVGIGGVGGYAFEALVRSGVKNITIVDADTISKSNINRQIIALQNNIGKTKVDVAKKRAELINPKATIKTVNEFLLEDNIDKLFKTKFDYIIDACDTISTKIALIKKSKEKKIKLISCMGTGNKIDPTKLEIIDIRKTNYDPVAKVVRKLLKELQINDKVMAVCSSEKPIKTNDRTPGSITTVPAVAGMYCASYIINDCIK